VACIALSIPIIAYLFLIISVCYSITFLLILIGFLHKALSRKNSEYPDVKISVIIAARNEENNLPRLLEDLKDQAYSEDLFDIIIADDHSDQRVASLAEIKDLRLQNLTVIDLPESVFGKKAALQLAAQKSTSEFLLFTDADCRVGRDWLTSFARKYREFHPAIIIGMVDYSLQNDPLKVFFRHEFISLIVCGIGSASMGFPTICNGANLGVNRHVYLKIVNQLKTKSPSGDDVFLLHQAKKNKEKILTNKERESIVLTVAPNTIGEFLNQRARWASKTGFYSDFATIYLALLVVITNLTFVICLIQLINNEFSMMICATTIVVKILTDYSVIIVGSHFFRGKRSLIWLPLFQLLYPVYLITSLTMGFLKLYRWKGRKY
jgi:poly-beta-1,6-N-acetyl-D-glucosamine synthase